MMFLSDCQETEHEWRQGNSKKYYGLRVYKLIPDLFLLFPFLLMLLVQLFCKFKMINYHLKLT